MIKNTASQKVGVQMVTAADGTAFTGSVTVSVTGDAGTQATGSVGSGACTHEGNGYHTYAPAQAETNYDLIAFTFTGTGAVPQTVQIYTRAATPDVNVTTIEGSDATNQIRDAVVDDATRIDASALNTLSGHDPGEVIMGATDLGTGAGLTSLATQASVDAIDDYVDTEVAAIKAKTDQLTFTVANVLDANTLRVGGTSQTARDLGASVLLSSGTGTGQLDFTSGVVKANLAQILGTALTETAGQIAAAFKQFFNVASPTGTMKAITNVVTATNLTNAPTSGDLTSTMKTSVTTAATAATPNLNAAYNAAKTAAQAGDAMALTSGERTTLAGVIWNSLTSGLTTASSIGKLLVDNINATISSRSSHAAADVWAVATRILTAATNITSTGGTTVPQTGDSYARIGAAGAGLTDIPWNANWDAEVQSEAEDALNAYDPPTHTEMTSELASADDAVLAAIAALNNLSSSAAATAVLTTAMTESYAADGSAPTLAQAIYLIQQRLTEFAITGTTISIKKLDGATEAATLTTNDATSPTSSTRAS